MLHSNNISRVDILPSDLGVFILSVANDSPSVEVLRTVCFKHLVDFIRVWSSQWTQWPIFWWVLLVCLFFLGVLLLNKVFRNMDVAVVLDVVQDNVIIINYSFTILAVLVSLLNVKSYSLSWRLVHQFYLLTCSVNLWTLLSILEVHSWVNVSKLNRASVHHLFSFVKIDGFLIITWLGLNSFLKISQFFSLQEHLLGTCNRFKLLFLCFILHLLIHFSHFLCFDFSAMFF